MKDYADNQFEIRIIQPSLSSLFSDDIDSQILSPLSCLREFGTYWLLEFDLPLVNKKDIKVTFDQNTIGVEAKLKETYYEEKLGVKTQFQYFKKTISLPGNINKNKTTAKFENGILRIIIPKKISGQKIKIN
ncbi:Hsp20/alpha crystallin family protein [Nitrosopumilus sp. K4]|uniref:Hsp20/alpha crystallin family protein n=1 Tax=Nitrosopumilus sp. K4 TaxID=2795383 RepID=UPI001BAB998C|nr:Hsp20/alpha crystallin family protein [Nitrosopumilus sp. K4]QUC64574.1 Hsp20/alpha crystallin family protein [Nitrosopumilus sp. K4]